MDVDSDPAASSKPAQMDLEDQTDTQGKGKAEEGSGKGEELADSISSLSIGPGRTNFRKKPVIIIVIGMAGTGKTTLMHRLVCDTQGSDKRGYVVNLDPAVMTLPFGANIDIRDTVRYKDVMKEYSLGPNGGILTSLNLFATKFVESSISNTSADYNLLVPNGTYVLTAGDCIKCSGSASNYAHLDCSPVQGRGCPAVQTCTGGLALGQSNGTDCASRMCAYTGYTNTTSLAIQTNLVPVNETACQKGGAARSEFAGSMWRTSAIAFLMALILICFL